MIKKLLVAMIVIGAFFRFYAVNWDSFGAFHPDERNISWAVTRIRFFSQMDPQFFAYGGLPIYLYRALGEGIVGVSSNPVWLADWGHIAVIGRFVSAVLATVSIYLMFLVGSVYFSQTVGLTAAALLAFSPWAIQQAHFQTTETMLVFFLLAMLYAAKTKNYVLLGLLWGLAMAAKTTAVLFGVIPLVAIGKKIRHTLVVGCVAALTFITFSPYTLLDFQHFKESMTYESGVAIGRFTVPYTLQFVHTIPYVYQITTMLWQAGPLVVAGLAGLIALAFRKKYWAFLIFPLIYFGWVGTWFAKFSRYNVPFLPFITLAGAWLSVKNKWLLGILLAVTAMWGLANFSVYMRPQTKIVATDWIRNNILQDSVIYTEHWNDGLPLDLPGVPRYRRELLTVYDEPDDAGKALYYADKLSSGDYIILSTRRIWATMPGLIQQYPVTSKFYTLLLSGTLGYKEVATFTSYPVINDDNAEESIQVFDHPTVRIFKNTERLSEEEIDRRLMSSMGS